MRITTLALLGLSLLVLTGCVAPKSEFSPAPGIFASYKAPLLLNYDETPVRGRKGTAETEYFHDILLTGLDFAWNDCSIKMASNNGHLNKIGSADYEFLNILGIYAKTTVHVYEAPKKK